MRGGLFENGKKYFGIKRMFIGYLHQFNCEF